MSQNNFDFDGPDFLRFLYELFDSGMPDNRDDVGKMCIGISKKAINEGWDTLSAKQQNVLSIMCDKLCYDHCAHWGDNIPWCEQMFAMQNDGMCSHCVRI